MKKKVLIIGAGFLQRYVIKKAKMLGYYTLAIDGNPNAIGLADADESAVVDIVDQEACLEYARKHKIDGVMTAATDYGVLSTAYVAAQLKLPAIDYNVAKTIKNKFLVRQCLYEVKADDTGLSHEVTDESNLEQLARCMSYPVMIKPCDGSGSRGASKVDNVTDFMCACKNALNQSLSRRATVEPFIEGKEYGVESFVVDGQIHVLGIMRKWMTQPPYYAELGHAIPSGLSVDTENKVVNCVKKAINALNIRFGSVNMDIIITDKESVHIIDIGARMGGNLIGSHIIPLGTGIDYIDNLIRATVGDPYDFTPGDHANAVASRLLALKPGVIKELPDMSSYASVNTTIEHHLFEGKQINEYRTNLDGCGYVVCTDISVEHAERKAEMIRKQIDDRIIRV